MSLSEGGVEVVVQIPVLAKYLLCVGQGWLASQSCSNTEKKKKERDLFILNSQKNCHGHWVLKDV